MSGTGTPAAPDLAAILATLSQFTNPVALTAPAPTPESQLESLRAEQEYDPAEPWTPAETIFTSHPLPVSAARAHDPRLRPQSRSATASPKPMIDPATIITWQEGLRCVTKIAAQNAQFAVSIRKMIADQRKHEMRWYSERQALKHAQASRVSASAQAQSILRSLGIGGFNQPPPEQQQSDKDAELADFDRKIYAAQVSMESAMSAELKGLGVPFFGTRSERVVPDGGGGVLNADAMSGSTITEGDLMALRRKMVGHLEDLYRD